MRLSSDGMAIQRYKVQDEKCSYMMDFSMAVRLMSIYQYQRWKMSYYLYKRGKEGSARNFLLLCIQRGISQAVYSPYLLMNMHFKNGHFPTSSAFLLFHSIPLLAFFGLLKSMESWNTFEDQMITVKRAFS